MMLTSPTGPHPAPVTLPNSEGGTPIALAIVLMGMDGRALPEALELTPRREKDDGKKNETTH